MLSAQFGAVHTRIGDLWFEERLFVDLDNNAGTYGSAAFTDSETKTDFDSDGGDQFNVHIHVIAGHAHLNAFGKGDHAGNVGGSETVNTEKDPRSREQVQ